MKRIVKITILILCSIGVAYAQTITKKAEIKVLGRAQTDPKIMLRWAPDTPRAFRKLAKYGYKLKRYTISIDGQTINKPILKELGEFKPASPEEWMKVIEKNNNAAVMAQALFGENFNVQGVGSLQGIINMSQEQEQRFTWALYAADQDFSVAQLAGLAFEDHEVRPNEKYVYKVFSLVPKSEMKINDGGVFIGMKDYEELPRPLDLAAIFDDQKVMLNWNYKIYANQYNSYFIERSENGQLFEQINKLPYTTLNSGGRVDTKRIYYIDSITNNKTYYYRVKGRTPFGELSPPSEVISGKGLKVLAYVPKISSKEIVNTNKSVLLEWEFLEEGTEFIIGFRLNKSNKVDGIYKPVIENIAPKERSIQYDDIDPTNYFTITAIGKNGSNRDSYPVLVQPIDSIPPVKPVGLEGKVDSLGVVTLEWKANTEPDMLGYRVFRGNNQKEEFSQITVSPHKATIFYDSIAVKNLNDKVYYKIVAVDQRYNMSEYSDRLILKKPDYIPPTSPVITSYEVKKGKVHLKWANSQSTDLLTHEVYRRVKDSVKWSLSASIPKDSLKVAYTDWVDSNVDGGTEYQYLIKAVDDSGLKSENENYLTIELPITKLRSGIKSLGSYVDKINGFIEIFWKIVDKDNLLEVMIYKGVKDKKVTLLRNAPQTITRIVDEDVHPNNSYIYMLRPVFKDGSLGAIKQMEVKY